MPAGALPNSNETVAAIVMTFFCMSEISDITKNFRTIAMRSINSRSRIAKGSDINRHFVFNADPEMLFKQWVCFLNDQVHRIVARFPFLLFKFTVQVTDHLAQRFFIPVIQ